MNERESDSLIDFAVGWWKNRHDHSYFPAMEPHKDWKVYENMLPWFLDLVKPNKDDTALEIGCGYGQWMVPLSKLVRSVYGVDIHESLYHKAYEKFKEYNSPNTIMTLSNGRDLYGMRDNFFSLVYSIAVFYHIPRVLVANYLRETKRVLKPDGRTLHLFLNSTQKGTKKDIGIGEKGEWSVGWTKEEIIEAGNKAQLSNVSVVDLGDCLVMLANK